MPGLLFQAVYMLIIVTIVLDFIIARIMRFINVGQSTILAPVIGTALGLLVFWMSPMSIAGIIVGAIATIVCNLILTNAVYPKFNDKMDEVVDKKIETSRGNDFDRALHSSTAEERVKYLSRNMQNNYCYRFQYSVDSAQVFQRVKETVDNSGLRSEYPELKIVSGEKGSEILFSVSAALHAVGIAFAPATADNKPVFMLGIYVYADEGKLKERMAFENRIGHLLDKLYTLSYKAIQGIDADFKVDIVPFKLPY
jgi:hypothetical protein